MQITALFKLVNSIVKSFTEVRQTRLEAKAQGINDFTSVLNLYNEVLKGWLIKSTKTPILTIIKDSYQSLDFIPTEGFILEGEKKQRFLQLQIRINTIFSNLIVNSTSRVFPGPL